LLWTLSPSKPPRTEQVKGSSAFIVGATLMKDAITSAVGMAISASAALPATASVLTGFANSLSCTGIHT
jgi:hypothetical protein